MWVLKKGINTHSVFRYLMFISYIQLLLFKDYLIINTIYAFISFISFSNNRASLVDIPSKRVTPVSFKSIMYVKV